jgi:hypothetical protein
VVLDGRQKIVDGVELRKCFHAAPYMKKGGRAALFLDTTPVTGY